MSQNHPLIHRLMNAIGPPSHTDNHRGFLIEVAKTIKGFPPVVQDKAANYLIRTAGKSWPSIKSIVEACIEAQNTIIITGHRSQPRVEPKTPWDIQGASSAAFACEYLRGTPLGNQALNEGWGRALRDYVSSWARARYRADEIPQLSQCIPVPDDIAYWRRHSCVPSDWCAGERTRLLGEPSISVTVAGAAKTIKSAAGKLFRTPLPLVISDDQFQIDQELGAV